MSMTEKRYVLNVMVCASVLLLKQKTNNQHLIGVEILDIKTFKTIDGLELIFKNRKSAVILEMNPNQASREYKFKLRFTTEGFKDLLQYIESIANKSWSNLTPKEADSLGADYYEYYDKEFDNNGCLSIGQDELLVERPSLESARLYQFNKRKMESFIHDFRKMVS